MRIPFAILKAGREFLRDADPMRDTICAGLRHIGVDANKAERGRPEERGSLGLIDIGNGPIRWIDVRKEWKPSILPAPLAIGGGTVYYTDYGIPDANLRGSPRVRIKPVYTKSFPVFGKVAALVWRGKDSGVGVIEALNRDGSIDGPIMYSPDLAIQVDAKRRCWLLSTETRDPPSIELWRGYQAIARRLLEVSR